MTHNIETLDFDTVDDFVDEIINNVLGEEDYVNCTTVANYELVNSIIRKLLIVDESFNLSMIDIDNIDYDDLYYLTITSDFKIYCEPIYYKGEQLLNESIYTYIHEDASWKVLDKLGNEFKCIFGIDELNK